MFSTPLGLTKPGLFVTATDTAVGKTVCTCAIAWALRQGTPGRDPADTPREGGCPPLRVGVCKPLASGCLQPPEPPESPPPPGTPRPPPDGLVSEDALALKSFSGCRQPLSVINPVRYAAPLAPAVAADLTGCPPDDDAIARSLRRLDAENDVVLIEGIGGVMVPLDDRHTVLDLIRAIGYPVVVVTRAGLGTLNHTALTVRALRSAGCRVAGLIVNHHPGGPVAPDDPSVSTNPPWLEKLNDVPVLAVLPDCGSQGVWAAGNRISSAILHAVRRVHWLGLAGAGAGADKTGAASD